jgi:hypothetical protein
MASINCLFEGLIPYPKVFLVFEVLICKNKILDMRSAAIALRALLTGLAFLPEAMLAGLQKLIAGRFGKKNK